jgi:hypothetical protein
MRHVSTPCSGLHTRHATLLCIDLRCAAVLLLVLHRARSFEREMYVIPNAVFSKNTVLNVTRKQREWRFYEFLCVRVGDVHKVNAIIQVRLVALLFGCLDVWHWSVAGTAGGQLHCRLQGGEHIGVVRWKRHCL